MKKLKYLFDLMGTSKKYLQLMFLMTGIVFFIGLIIDFPSFIYVSCVAKIISYKYFFCCY